MSGTIAGRFGTPSLHALLIVMISALILTGSGLPFAGPVRAAEAEPTPTPGATEASAQPAATSGAPAPSAEPPAGEPPLPAASPEPDVTTFPPLVVDAQGLKASPRVGRSAASDGGDRKPRTD